MLLRCAEDAGDRLGAVARVGLGQDLADVPFDRALGQEQPFADRGVGEARATSRMISSCRAVSGACGMSEGSCAVPQRELLELVGASSELGGGALQRLLGEFGVGDVLHDPDRHGSADRCR